MPAPVDFWTENTDGTPVCIMVDIGPKHILATAEDDKLTGHELSEAMAEEYPDIRLRIWSEGGYVYGMGAIQ